MKFLIILLNPCSLETLPWSVSLFWPSSTALLFGLKADSDGCLSELTGCCSSNSPGDTGVCSLLKNIESLVWKWCGQLRVLQVLADSSILTRLIVIMRNEGRVAGLNHLSTMNRRRIRQVIRKMSTQGKPILNAIVTACFALLYLFSEPDPAKCWMDSGSVTSSICSNVNQQRWGWWGMQLLLISRITSNMHICIKNHHTKRPYIESNVINQNR